MSLLKNDVEDYKFITFPAFISGAIFSLLEEPSQNPSCKSENLMIAKG